MNGRLTTHVLDLVQGKPAAGMTIELYYFGIRDRVQLGRFETNADGRLDRPMLQGSELQAGQYELVFAAGDYLKQATDGVTSASLASIFDLIPIRFRVTDPEAHYHVPLLVAPGGYSTYRGS